MKVEIEVSTVASAREAVDAGADAVLLDNMSLDDIRSAVTAIKGRVMVEVSGGITLETVRDIAALGVDIISVGALTHLSPPPTSIWSYGLVPHGSRHPAIAFVTEVVDRPRHRSARLDQHHRFGVGRCGHAASDRPHRRVADRRARTKRSYVENAARNLTGPVRHPTPAAQSSASRMADSRRRRRDG